MEEKINPTYFIKTKEGNSKDIEKFEYPDYIDFNNKIGSLLIVKASHSFSSVAFKIFILQI